MRFSFCFCCHFKEDCGFLLKYCGFFILSRSFLVSIDKRGKFSRKRLNEDEGDITYINEHNKVFNKKVRMLIILGQDRFNEHLLFALLTRLHGTTTSIRKKLEIALSGVLLCRVNLFLVGQGLPSFFSCHFISRCILSLSLSMQIVSSLIRQSSLPERVRGLAR